MRIFGSLTTDRGEPLSGWTVVARDEFGELPPADPYYDESFSLLSTRRLTGDIIIVDDPFPYPRPRPRPVLQALTAADGTFVIEDTRTLYPGTQPQLTFYVSEGQRPVNVLAPRLEWDVDSTKVELLVTAPPPPVSYLYGRVWDDAVRAGVPGVDVVATDRAKGYEVQRVSTGDAGLFELWFPWGSGEMPDVELQVRRDDQILAIAPPMVSWSPYAAAAVPIHLAWSLEGVAVDRATDAGAAGVRIEAWDDGQFLGAADSGADGRFTLLMTRRPGFSKEPAPALSLRAYRAGQLLETLTPALSWSAEGFAEARIEVGTQTEELPTVFTVEGVALDRRTRRGAPGLRVEAWDAAQTYLLAADETGSDGQFGFTIGPDAGGGAPQPRFRVYRDGQLLAQPALPVVWSGAHAKVFLDVDVPTPPPKSYRVVGRLVDSTSRAGLADLRVEAWDTAPRAGGAVGAAAVSAGDGAFDIALPPRGDALASGPPSVYFRVYQQDRLVASARPPVAWAVEGVGTTVVEILAPAAVSQEVGLHELGESIAGTVDRVQTELSRYPTTMGAYVLDEIDLQMPVEMRVDEMAQVRTKVVDATTPDKNVGQLRMKVRPVLGAQPPTTEVSDQPLSVLSELTPEAIKRLEAERIYSVEDLTRAAATGAGRAALDALKLVADLDPLLAKAQLLAFGLLPRPVREALVRLGVADLRAFAGADPVVLAEGLAAQLEQDIAEDDVAAWQETVARALAIPLPTDETVTT